MGIRSYRASVYFNYITKRRSIQYIHSPFLFALMLEVFDDSKDKWPHFFSIIEDQRKKLMLNDNKIEFEDFGAGADRVGGVNQVSINTIAKRSLKQAKYARFLYRLANHTHSKNIVELGTSLGVTTSYLASVESSNIYTVEADRNIQKIAQQSWDHLSMQNIFSYSFDLNEKWSLLACEMELIDLLFIDANHRKEAMIRYYFQALPYMHQRSVVVFDDIYWSEETEQAWEILKNREEVTLSFDIFQMGVLFFDKNLSKEDYTLKY